jgi:hypothetical protein
MDKPIINYDLDAAPIDRSIMLHMPDGMSFLASYRDVGCDSAWCADDADDAPECWSDGVCWGLNAAGFPSTQPVGWSEDHKETV